MLSYPPNTYEQHLPPMPTFGRRSSVSSSLLYNTSSYKYAIFDIDLNCSELYAPTNTNNDDFSSFRSFLPVSKCCFAVYKLTFIMDMRPFSAIIFCTWLPPAASESEKHRYVSRAGDMMKKLSHCDFHFVCSEWKEFQHVNAVSRVRKLIKAE
ncbi:hypothetical protein LPJ64_005729 [Coemansia asiatica]|uniref:ADF-H domain-containing protein n=1 Tax=Coemansia asiatica TaxID=1052880 RepID=A0A9W7XDV2_9FUNG|nr:hypothetical protein LPJ64_005729 [Coemansia asiatica]